MNNKEPFDNRPKVKSRKLNILPQNPESNNNCSEDRIGPGRFPSWLHRKLPPGSNLASTGRIVQENRLHTVCEEAKCPNLLECWSHKTATFLVMGKDCTRNCGFCDINFDKSPKPLEEDEPYRVADSVKKLGLEHVVITMVARDDLPDGGAAHLAKIILEIRKEVPGTTIEVLTSDFCGNQDSIKLLLEAKPEIFNHNVETVKELTPRVRHKATYERTLGVLSFVKKSNIPFYIKSGLMVGLGETDDQVYNTLIDLKSVGCDIVTIGQYLQPNRNKLLVKAFVPPEQFKKYEEMGYSLGIKQMYCGPFIRSSYNANLVMKQANNQTKIINSN